MSTSKTAASPDSNSGSLNKKPMLNGSHSRRTGNYLTGQVQRMPKQTSTQKQIGKKIHNHKQRHLGKNQQQLEKFA